MDIRMSNIASPMPQIRAKFTNKLGIPLSGCKVYTYEPNSDTPKTTWLNIDKTTENTNPILLDAAGEADIFLDGLYRVVVKDRFGFVVYDVEKTGTHTELDASFVVDKSGKTQQEINDNQADINNELYIYKEPVVYAHDIKTDGSDQLAKLNAYAIEATSKKLTLVLPAGVICISDEFVPPDYLTLRGSTETLRYNGVATVLKWIGADGTDKAVLRCSRSPIETTPTASVSGVNIKISIDATGCDYGAYFRDFTNESRASIYTFYSNKCGIAVLQSWFSRFENLISVEGKGVGISIGVPLSSETGDTDVNSIQFDYVRAHGNGINAGYADNPTDIKKGCGIIVNSRACTYSNIQSELNYGVGMIENSYLRNNAYESMYFENNCKSGGENLGLVNYGTHTLINNLYLSMGSRVRNNGEIVRILNCTKDGDENGISTAGTGKIAYCGNNYNLLGYLSPSDYARLVYSDTEIVKDIGKVNLKYSSDNPFPSTDFYLFSQGSVYAVFVPSVTATMTKKAIFYIDDTYLELNVVNPIAGKPIYIRLPLEKGRHNFRLTDPATTDDFLAQAYLVRGVLPSGNPADAIDI